MDRTALLTDDDLASLDFEDLCRLWEDLPWLYRLSIARHPRTSLPFILWAIKRDDHLLWNLSYGSGFPKDLVWDLFVHLAFKHGDVARCDFRYTNLTSDQMIALTDMGGLNARSRLIDNVTATGEVLERLSRDARNDIRRMARKRLVAKRAAGKKNLCG